MILRYWSNNQPKRQAWIKLCYPPLKATATAAASTALDNSFRPNTEFQYSGSKFWNILPPEINMATALPSFKTKLGALLKKNPDNPPTVGYIILQPTATLWWIGKDITVDRVLCENRD